MPAEFSDPPVESRRPRSHLILIGCAITAGIAVLLCVSVVVFGWSHFVAYGVVTDFTEYQRDIRSLQLDPELKQNLLARIESLREKARAKPPPFWRWLDFDASIRALIQDGNLPPDEALELNRELDRVEASF